MQPKLQNFVYNRPNIIAKTQHTFEIRI